MISKPQIKLGAHSSFRFSWHFISWAIGKFVGACMCLHICIWAYMYELVGIYLCMWVGTHVCMHVYMCVCTCRGQRSPSGVILPTSFTLLLFFWGSVSHWTWISLSRLGWLSRELQGSACLYIPSVESIGTCHHAWLFYVGTMYQSQVLVFAQSALKLPPTPLATVRWMWDSLDYQNRK